MNIILSDLYKKTHLTESKLADVAGRGTPLLWKSKVP